MCVFFLHCNSRDGNLIANYIKWDTIHRSRSFNSHHIIYSWWDTKTNSHWHAILLNEMNATCWFIQAFPLAIPFHHILMDLNWNSFWAEPVYSFNVINHIARAHQAIHFLFSILYRAFFVSHEIANGRVWLNYLKCPRTLSFASRKGNIT